MTLTSAVLSGGALAGQTSGLPDVVVDAIRWSDDGGLNWYAMTEPLPASVNILFQCDVRNQGTAPTPQGVILGVLFSISSGGAFVPTSWSDTHVSALPVGHTVTLTANGGPDAAPYWNAPTNGLCTLRAHVDDVARFTEASDSNNILDLPLTVGTGIQPPAQAAAAGYTSLVFYEEFLDTSGIDMADSRQAGFNFYRFGPFGIGVLGTDRFSVVNSVLTIDSNLDFNYGLGSTCGIGGNQWVGFDVTGGAYFEASIAFEPLVSAPGWPAFWSMATEHLWGGNNEGWIEANFFEKYWQNKTKYITGGHWWDPQDVPATVFPTVSGYDWEQFHIYGFLWVPGDRWQHYRDNVSIVQLPYSSYPFLANGDAQRWPVILGSDGHPMQVDWVRVWAAA